MSLGKGEQVWLRGEREPSAERADATCAENVVCGVLIGDPWACSLPQTLPGFVDNEGVRLFTPSRT